MFFVVSKLLWLIADPLTLGLAVAVLGALMLSWLPRLGRAFALVGAGGLLIVAVFPVGALLVRPLEQRFPPPPADAPAPYGLIALGGAIDDERSNAHGETTFEDSSAARLTETAILARRFPQAKVVYTGGSAAIANSNSTEATEARKLLIALGVDPQRIEIETRSRNTDENARFTAAIVKPAPEQSWWLVTSAYHMPRSMGLFEKSGFKVVAFPVDFRTLGDDRDFLPNREPSRGLRLFEIAAHEWIGLAAYHLAGKIDQWFPGP